MNIGEGFGKSKCLILGGYLVLDHSNTALVVSLSPKVRCTAQVLADISFCLMINTHPSNLSFEIAPKDWKDPSTFNEKYEKFILSSFHTFFSQFPIPNSKIVMEITGDDQFYTGNGKTGLGSSSATTVSIMKCLFNLFQPSLPSLDTFVFKYAAVAHSIAQGNIGSCFDISCSVWGSQIFRRPSPHFVSIEKINEQWDNEHISFNLPKSLYCLLLSTPFGGSSTPSLVRAFNSKAKEDPTLYNNLKASVNAAADILQNGNHEEIRKSFREVRNVLRTITTNWEIDILPPSVDEIATKAENIDGVIASIIPGAGGYDSIAVIAKSCNIDFSSLGLNVITYSS